MPTDGERLATVEAVLQEIRGDVHDLKIESERTRNRLHSLEGVSSAFMAMQQQNREQERRQYQRLGTKIAQAGLLLTAAVVLEPIIRAFIH